MLCALHYPRDEPVDSTLATSWPQTRAVRGGRGCSGDGHSFVVEMTGATTLFVPLFTACASALAAPALLGCRPICDTLRARDAARRERLLTRYSTTAKEETRSRVRVDTASSDSRVDRLFAAIIGRPLSSLNSFQSRHSLRQRISSLLSKPRVTNWSSVETRA